MYTILYVFILQLLAGKLNGGEVPSEERDENLKTLAICLVQRGAKLEIANHKGQTPLHLLENMDLKLTLMEIATGIATLRASGKSGRMV